MIDEGRTLYRDARRVRRRAWLASLRATLEEAAAIAAEVDVAGIDTGEARRRIAAALDAVTELDARFGGAFAGGGGTVPMNAL